MLVRCIITLFIAANLWATARGATITVTSLADVVDSSGGDCSLREAVANANANTQTHSDCAAGDGMDDTIEFDASLFSGNEATITLDGSALFVSDGNDDLTIDAGANRRVIIRTDATQRLLDVDIARRIELTNITLLGGTDGFGGGLSVFATDVVLNGVEFIDNAVDVTNQPGAGLYFSSRVDGGTLTMRDCLFENNNAPRAGGGAYLLVNHGITVTIEDCVLRANDSGTEGGAIFLGVSNNALDGIASLEIRRTEMTGNSATNGGGGLGLDINSVSAGIDVLVEASSFSDNSTEFRGAAISLDNQSSASVAQVKISQSTFRENQGERTSGESARGGAVWARNMDLAIENTLFYGNRSDGNGGALSLDYESGALSRSASLLGNTFFDNTINNDGERGRSLFFQVPAANSPLNAVIRGNAFEPVAIPPQFTTECDVSQGAITDLDTAAVANLASGTECLFSANDILGDAGLVLEHTADPLRPLTAFANASGPATEGWPIADCVDAMGSPLVVDLLEEVRPADGDGIGSAECDIGAFERPDAGILTVVSNGSGTGEVISTLPGIDCGSDCSEPFAGGVEVELVASASTGSVFIGWGGPCSGTGSCMVTVSGNDQVTATFDTAPSAPVTVSTSGDGSGLVTSSPSGISCPPACEASFAQDSTVVLSATPEFDSEFTQWSGACSGTASCDVTASGSPAVDALFNATDFVLDVAIVGTGNGTVTSQPAGIACPGDCAELYPRSEIVTLTVLAGAGSRFLGWSPPCDGTGVCILDMNMGPYAVDARIEDLSTISVALDGVGNGRIVSTPAGIDCPGDCSEEFPRTTELTLTAMPEPGSVFVQWSGAPASCTGTAPCVFDVAADRAVTGIFQAGIFSLDVTIDGDGSVSSSPTGIACPGDCQNNYASGTMITLDPTASHGNTFTGWSGACTGAGPCTVIMDQAQTVGATFLSETIFASGFEP